MRLYASGDQYLFCIYILIKDITNWGLEMTRLIGGSQEILNLWINHFNDNNALGILDLYDQKATLVPTFSSTFATNKKQIKGYFDKLFLKQSINVTLEEDSIDELDTSNCQIIFGNYIFSHKLDGNLVTYPCRYTFILDLERSGPILHHHSSQLP
tara:strand:+ start:1778 stop:2242 length:465 start_codon:yes stop_codon:yes gene_type:complete